jgi:hypothetical protein
VQAGIFAINDNVFFDQAATYTVTISSALCFDMTVSRRTVTFSGASTLGVSVCH